MAKEKIREFVIVYSAGGGRKVVICFSEALFKDFLLDPGYFNRFTFCLDGVCVLKGELQQKVEGLIAELIDVYFDTGNVSVDLIKVLLLRLFFVLKEQNTYLGDYGGTDHILQESF